MPVIFVAGTEEEIQAGKGKVVITLTQAASMLRMNEASFRRLVEKDLITPYPERVRGMPVYLEHEVELLRESRKKQGY